MKSKLSNLSSTIFAGRATDAVATPDVYNQTGEVKTNSLYEGAKKAWEDTIISVGSSPRAMAEMANLVIAAKNKEISKMDLINSVLSKSGNSVAGLSNSLLNKAGEFIASTGIDTGKIMQTGKVVYDNVTFLMQAKDLREPAEILNFLGELTGKSDLISFVGLESEIAFMGAVLDDMVKSGYIELLEDIIDATTPDVKYDVWGYGGYSSIEYGNLDGLNKVLDMVDPYYIEIHQPDPVGRLLATYSIPYKDIDGDHRKLSKEFITTLERLDKNWYKFKRGDKWEANFSRFSNISFDAEKLLKLDKTVGGMVSVGRNAMPKSTRQVISEMYPNVFIPDSKVI